MAEPADVDAQECPGQLDAITVDDASQAIPNLSGKKLSLNYVPVSILKSDVDIFAPLIARLANLFFSDGCLPDMFKFGQVRSLLTKPVASTTDMANIRQITNLNTIGKILEGLDVKEFRRHSSRSSHLGQLQTAYRSLHSTETATTKVVSHVLSAVDSGELSVLLCLDISAAFDTLDHRLLLSQAHQLFGISVIVLGWL